MAHPLPTLDNWLYVNRWPRVACPVCTAGSIGFDSATHQLDQESLKIVHLCDQNLGPPDELSGTFTGTLKCDNSSCDQYLAMAGDWQLVFNDDPREGQFVEAYRIRYINPAPKIIEVPARAPKRVHTSITQASEILWLSPNAAANRLRYAIEELLSAKRVPKTSLSKTGRRTQLTLHTRIAKFRETRPEVAEALEAVKWIGNAGSHDNQLSATDVLVGARILDVAIRALYDRTDAELRAKVRAINRARGLSTRR